MKTEIIIKSMVEADVESIGEAMMIVCMVTRKTKKQIHEEKKALPTTFLGAFRRAHKALQLKN